jgi:hypothetical protein
LHRLAGWLALRQGLSLDFPFNINNQPVGGLQHEGFVVVDLLNLKNNPHGSSGKLAGPYLFEQAILNRQRQWRLWTSTRWREIDDNPPW